MFDPVEKRDWKFEAKTFDIVVTSRLGTRYDPYEGQQRGADILSPLGFEERTVSSLVIQLFVEPVAETQIHPSTIH